MIYQQLIFGFSWESKILEKSTYYIGLKTTIQVIWTPYIYHKDIILIILISFFIYFLFSSFHFLLFWYKTKNDNREVWSDGRAGSSTNFSSITFNIEFTLNFKCKAHVLDLIIILRGKIITTKLIDKKKVLYLAYF